uniref:Uncharacterized protein n=1 Tax=Anguilla anguilla TaxID=7936 RepID=A0A0E9T5B0_ANGAN
MLDNFLCVCECDNNTGFWNMNIVLRNIWYFCTQAVLIGSRALFISSANKPTQYTPKGCWIAF